MPKVSTTISAAALTDLQVALGSFADNYQIGVYAGADFAGGYAFETLLVNNAGYGDIACKVALGCAEIFHSGNCHAAQSALHIRGAAAVHFAVCDFACIGRMNPLVSIGYGNGIHMAVKENGLAGLIAMDGGDEVAEAVNYDIFYAVAAEILGKGINYAVLMTGIAGSGNKSAAQGYGFFKKLGVH